MSTYNNGVEQVVSHTHLLAAGATDITATAAEVNVLSGIPGTLTAAELGYVDGVTSAIQTQLNGKPTIKKVAYNGDGGASNTAVAHTLGATPKIVIITKDAGSYHFFLNTSGKLHYAGTAGAVEVGIETVTAMDATNFYVGGASDSDKYANKNGIAYTAFVIG